MGLNSTDICVTSLLFLRFRFHVAIQNQIFSSIGVTFSNFSSKREKSRCYGIQSGNIDSGCWLAYHSSSKWELLFRTRCIDQKIGRNCYPINVKTYSTLAQLESQWKCIDLLQYTEESSFLLSILALILEHVINFAISLPYYLWNIDFSCA